MKKTVDILVVLTMLCLTAMPVRGGDGTSMALLYGRLTDQDFMEIPFQSPEIESVHMVGISLRQELVQLNEKAPFFPSGFFLDGEIVLAEKWGRLDGVSQDFQEIAGSFNLRYAFSEQLPCLNSISLGNGLSLTGEESTFEKNLTLGDKTSGLLWYMLLEADFDIPHSEQWKVLFRIHHRSGVFGLFDNVDGGSNYITMGLRYFFNGN